MTLSSGRALQRFYIVALLLMGVGSVFFSSVANAALNDGLVAYYPFDGNANDASGNSKQIMLNPTIYYAGGVISQGLASTESNNGAANQIVLPNPFAGEHFTISYWVNAKVDHNKTYGDSGIAVWASAAYLNLQSFGMTSSSGNHPVYFKHEYPELIVSNSENNTGLGASLYYANNQLAESKWQHILLTYENGTINVYINGSIAITNKQTTVSPIGRNLDIYLKSNDKLDDLRIYNRALTTSEVAELYAQGTTKTPNSDLSLTADPYEKWKGWQDAGNATVHTSQLRDGNVYNLTPAEIIYYSAQENAINPLLLLVKLQTEQNLISKSYAYPELTRRLERAVGYGYIESNPSQSKWIGFYPQLVGMSYEFATMQTKKNFHDAFIEYTPHESKYEELVQIYAGYAAKMNTIARKNYAAQPESSGYLQDFRDISVNDIQTFLNAFNGNLKNTDLFPKMGIVVTPVVGAKIINKPTIPAQLKQNGWLSFTVNTDLPADKVTMVFSNPDAEKSLTGSADGKTWTFKSKITVANNRPWLLQVYSGKQITDASISGNLNVIGSTQLNLAQWQKDSIQYANEYNALYNSTPLRNVAGNTCGKYTFCFAFSRQAVDLASTGLSAYPSFVKLLADKKAVKDSDFSHAPIGSVVFYKTGVYGHAAIKVDETHTISQGQLGARDCTISKIEWNKVPNYVGYYAPALGSTSLLNFNEIPEDMRVTRGDFLNALAAVIETVAPDLPDDVLEKARLMSLLNDPDNFDADSPIIRQDAARLLSRTIVYFEDKGKVFKKTGDSNRFANDEDTKQDLVTYAIAVRMAELGLFGGDLQEDGSYLFSGERQLSKTEKDILLNRLLKLLKP